MDESELLKLKALFGKKSEKLPGEISDYISSFSTTPSPLKDVLQKYPPDKKI